MIVGTGAPTDSASAVRVTMDKIGGHWLVSAFDPHRVEATVYHDDTVGPPTEDLRWFVRTPNSAVVRCPSWKP